MPDPRRGWLLAILALLFSVRVLAQAVQRLRPTELLPPFGAFQGSRLGYPTLLGSQLAILSLMARSTARAFRSIPPPSVRAAALTFALGALYLALALARIAIGIGVPGAPPWFPTWIPAAFHVVLAGFVLTAGDLARRRAASAGRDPVTR